jgi:hypothetical protein
MAKLPSITFGIREQSKEQETFVQEIVDCVNDPAKPPVTMRLEKMISTFRSAESCRTALYRGATDRKLPVSSSWGFFVGPIESDAFFDSDLHSLARAYERAITELKSMLAEYHWIPSIAASYTQIRFTWDFATTDESARWENLAVNWLFNTHVGKDIAISLLRRCKYCDRWFYRNTKGKRHCSQSCRVSVYNRTPGGRANHAQAQRRYVENVKAQEDAELKRAGIKPSNSRRRVAVARKGRD